MIFVSFILVLLLALLFSFCISEKTVRNFLLKTKISFKHIIITSIIFELISVFSQLTIYYLFRNSIHISVIITNIACLTLYFIVNLFTLVRTKKLERTEKALEAEKIYNQTLTVLHDNLRCFKHDFNNIVQSIGGYISLNDMDGLKKYYNNLLADCKETNNLALLNPEVINNPSIYSLLTSKYFLATEKGIKMTFDVFTDLSSINFNIYELTRILGILLDNAIEAAQCTTEKLIEIEITSNTKKQLFVICNSCENDDISVTQIFEKGYTTKELNSGIGLWKVHNILSKNENVDLFTSVKNHRFMQQLEIFYDK